MNVARRLSEQAAARPDQPAVAQPLGYDRAGRRRYRVVSFRELDRLSDRIARGLRERGAEPGMRLALLVKPSVEFVALVFGMLKAGVVQILIDPGMGHRHMLGCLAEAEPRGFIGIPAAQAARVLFARRFPLARLNVTVGRRWFWRGPTFVDLIGHDDAPTQLYPAGVDDPAAIIFTSGSTGPPKGVLYRHGNFDAQVDELRRTFDLPPGGADLACFPLFGLFNAALGLTTVLPDMDASRPARANPARLVEAITDWQVEQSFASPAVWQRVGEYCRLEHVKLPTLTRVFSAGAPIPPRVVAALRECIASGGQIHTPYGATEALPVASLNDAEILSDTAAQWAQGRGTCVGRRFAEIEWRVIPIVDGPLTSAEHWAPLPTGTIGELLVRGAVVTTEYVTRPEANERAKLHAEGHLWHRMGDVGYLDSDERFWFCGRLTQRVVTPSGTLFTDPVEGVINQHPRVARSALVGLGPAGAQRPVVVVEPRRDAWPASAAARHTFRRELLELASRYEPTRHIERFLFHRSFPVDVRHNAKIFRERLAAWAATQPTLDA